MKTISVKNVSEFYFSKRLLYAIGRTCNRAIYNCKIPDTGIFLKFMDFNFCFYCKTILKFVKNAQAIVKSSNNN